MFMGYEGLQGTQSPCRSDLHNFLNMLILRCVRKLWYVMTFRIRLNFLLTISFLTLGPLAGFNKIESSFEIRALSLAEVYVRFPPRFCR